jgi:hypothetical protein
LRRLRRLARTGSSTRTSRRAISSSRSATVNRLGNPPPSISNEHIQVSAAALDEQHLPILHVLIDATPALEIADMPRSEISGLRRRTGRMLAGVPALAEPRATPPPAAGAGR